MEAKAPYQQGRTWYSVSRTRAADAGKDRRQKEKRAAGGEMAGEHSQVNGHELGQTLEKRAAGDEMAGEHSQVNGHELGQTLEDSEGLGGLACCSPRGHRESDTTQQLNINNTSIY